MSGDLVEKTGTMSLGNYKVNYCAFMSYNLYNSYIIVHISTNFKVMLLLLSM